VDPDIDFQNVGPVQDRYFYNHNPLYCPRCYRLERESISIYSTLTVAGREPVSSGYLYRISGLKLVSQSCPGGKLGLILETLAAVLHGVQVDQHCLLRRILELKLAV